MSPTPKVETINRYINISNVSDHRILYSVVSGTGEPTEFAELGTKASRTVLTGADGEYTLYCYLYYGDTVRYENGYAMTVKSISTRYQEHIEIDAVGNFIIVGNSGDVITFKQIKYRQGE